MKTDEAITELRSMQRQIIHGTNIFGDIADTIAALEQRCAGLEKALEAMLTQYGNVRAAEGYPQGDSISMRHARAVLSDTKESK